MSTEQLRAAALALFDPMPHGSPSKPNEGHIAETHCPVCVSVRAARTQSIRRALVALGALPSVSFRAALAAPATDEGPSHLTERFDHDGTFRHHHDSITRDPIWWEHAEQFGGEKREHRHAASATDEGLTRVRLGGTSGTNPPPPPPPDTAAEHPARPAVPETLDEPCCSQENPHHAIPTITDRIRVARHWFDEAQAFPTGATDIEAETDAGVHPPAGLRLDVADVSDRSGVVTVPETLDGGER